MLEENKINNKTSQTFIIKLLFRKIIVEKKIQSRFNVSTFVDRIKSNKIYIKHKRKTYVIIIDYSMLRVFVWKNRLWHCSLALSKNTAHEYIWKFCWMPTKKHSQGLHAYCYVYVWHLWHICPPIYGHFCLLVVHFVRLPNSTKSLKWTIKITEK